MKYLVLFKDSASAEPGLRARHMAEHLDFLERNAAAVRAAGPLRRADGGAAGGVWIVDAGSAKEVDALVKGDPFWPTGLRESVEILEWTQVFAEGQRKVALS